MIEIERLLTDKSELAARTINEIKPFPERNNTEVSINYMEKFLKVNSNIFLLSSIEKESIGYLLAYKLDRVDRIENMVLLYEINVIDQFRRKGIAKSMIDKLKKICVEINTYKMWVLTDKRNNPAINLYTTTGGKRMYEDGVLFIYNFK